MIRLVGDLHGNYSKLTNIVDDAKAKGITKVIQLGDFGWYKQNIRYFDNHSLSLPVEWIDGNHEDHSLVAHLTEITEVAPNLFFVPRGTTQVVEGKKIAYLGGASSVDKQYRLDNGWHWSSLENISPEERARFDGVDDIDLFLTHCPPQSVIQRHFDPNSLKWFGLPPTWKDVNADVVEDLWQRWGCPMTVAGHMHREVIGEKYRILNIDQYIDI